MNRARATTGTATRVYAMRADGEALLRGDWRGGDDPRAVRGDLVERGDGAADRSARRRLGDLRAGRVYAMRADGEALLRGDWRARVGAARLAEQAEMANADNRRRTLAADLLLSRALEERYGSACLPPRRARDENGKPRIEGLPDFHFNLSHAGCWAVCAVAEGPVGVDIERVARIDMRVPARFFAPSERAQIESQADACAFWVLKESYVKALGVGLRLPLNAFQITLGEPIALTHPGEEREFSLSLLGFPDHDYRLGLCEAGPRTAATLTIVEVEALL